MSSFDSDSRVILYCLLLHAYFLLVSILVGWRVHVNFGTAIVKDEGRVWLFHACIGIFTLLSRSISYVNWILEHLLKSCVHLCGMFMLSEWDIIVWGESWWVNGVVRANRICLRVVVRRFCGTWPVIRWHVAGHLDVREDGVVIFPVAIKVFD